MRVARATARTQRYRGDAEGDRDVGVGGGAGELMVVPDGASRGHCRLHQGMRARRQPGRTVADAAHIELQRRRGGCAVAILVLERLLEKLVRGRIEPMEDTRIFAPQIHVEPGGLRNRVQAGAATEPHNRARTAR